MRDLVQALIEENPGNNDRAMFGSTISVKHPVCFDCFDKMLTTVSKQETHLKQKRDQLENHMKMEIASTSMVSELDQLDDERLEEELKKLEFEETKCDLEL